MKAELEARLAAGQITTNEALLMLADKCNHLEAELEKLKKHLEHDSHSKKHAS